MERIKRKTSPAFAIVADGETEIWYLQMMQRNERRVRLTIKPELPKKKRIEDQCELVCKLAQGEYDKVFWIVDLDQIVKERREATGVKKDPMRTFIECREKVLHGKKYAKRIRVIVNNPCLEFWFLLHFMHTSKSFDCYDQVEKELKKYIQDYNKSEGYFKQKNNDIYSKLKPRLKKAIEHSDRLGSFDPQAPSKAVSEMPQFFRTEELNGLF